MSNTVKKTQKELFAEILELEAIQTNPEWKEFIEGRISAIAKKSASAKDNEKKAENEAYKDGIMTAFKEKPALYISVSDMMKVEPVKSYDLTNQKVSYLMNDLVKEGRLDKKLEKGRTYFFNVKVEG